MIKEPFLVPPAALSATQERQTVLPIQDSADCQATRPETEIGVRGGEGLSCSVGDTGCSPAGNMSMCYEP